MTESRRSVELPDDKEIARRLQEGGLLGIAPQVDDFCLKLVARLTKAKLVDALELGTVWGCVLDESFPKSSGGVRNLVDCGYFDLVVGAITQDEALAKEASQVRALVCETKALFPPPKYPLFTAGDLPPDSIHDYTRYTQARRIADVVFEYGTTDLLDLQSEKPYMMDKRANRDVPPIMDRGRHTYKGFFLERYFESLVLWTPWGEYSFASIHKVNYKKLASSMPDMLRRLGAIEALPWCEWDGQRSDYFQINGPIYGVTKVDDERLPEPVYKYSQEYKGYNAEAAKDAWGMLANRYFP